jgi:hypothetical protein
MDGASAGGGGGKDGAGDQLGEALNALQPTINSTYRVSFRAVYVSMESAEKACLINPRTVVPGQNRYLFSYLAGIFISGDHFNFAPLQAGISGDNSSAFKITQGVLTRR